MILILCLLGWLGCAVLAYGIALAYWHRKSHEIFARDMTRGDIVLLALQSMAGGPITLFVAYVMSGCAENGVMFWPTRQATTGGSAVEKLCS